VNVRVTLARRRAGVLVNSIVRFLKDESGAEVVEYALLLGMLVCASIVLISALGNKVLQRWTKIDEMLNV
jgi:Flp pilus assembly pilin Flp